MVITPLTELTKGSRTSSATMLLIHSSQCGAGLHGACPLTASDTSSLAWFILHALRLAVPEALMYMDEAEETIRGKTTRTSLPPVMFWMQE